MNELYEELEKPEGEGKIFRIAKARDQATKDFSHMKQIKIDRPTQTDQPRPTNPDRPTENERTWCGLRDLDMIIRRWKGYFDKLLNEENPRSIFDDGVPNEGLTQVISRNEVNVAISRNEEWKRNGNGWDSSRGVEVFGRRGYRHAVESDARDIQYEQEKIPTDWRDSTAHISSPLII